MAPDRAGVGEAGPRIRSGVPASAPTAVRSRQCAVDAFCGCRYPEHCGWVDAASGSRMCAMACRKGSCPVGGVDPVGTGPGSSGGAGPACGRGLLCRPVPTVVAYPTSIMVLGGPATNDPGRMHPVLWGLPQAPPAEPIEGAVPSGGRCAADPRTARERARNRTLGAVQARSGLSLRPESSSTDRSRIAPAASRDAADMTKAGRPDFSGRPAFDDTTWVS